MRYTLPLLALAGALALAGCDSSDPAANAVEENVVEAPIVEEPVNIPVINEIEEEPAANTVETVPPPAPAPVISDEQQTLDDADAIGLTSRIPEGDSGETPPPPGEGRNDSAPEL